MPDETQKPAQSEGAGSKKKAAPVNLALVEAQERGIDLDSPPPPKRNPSASADPLPPPANPEPAEATAPVEPPPAPTPADGPPPETTAEPEAVPPPTGTPREQLEAMAAAATAKRLSAQDEDRATALLRACIANGDSEAAVAAMPKLPWILGVRAIEQAWPDLPEAIRADLLSRLAALETDHSIRLRLSVARSLAKLDPPVGTQLAGAVCSAIWNAETSSLSSEHSKLIGNVFIGRGRPWVLNLPLDAMEPQHADAVASAVVFSAFHVNNPPITQLSILRYAGSRLANLSPELLAMIARSVGRWSTKWQESLRKEVPNLPDSLTAALKAPRPGRGEPAATGTPDTPGSTEAAGEQETESLPIPVELEQRLKLALETGDPEAVAAANQEINAWRDAQAQQPSPERAGQSAEHALEPPTERRSRRGRERGERAEKTERAERKERPAYVSREQEAAARGQAPFNLGTTLKQIESYVAQLRNELAQAQAKLRKAESAPRRPAADKVLLSVEEANLSSDELKRLVLQLEQRNSELQTRVEELLADSETRALATAADADVTAQYRTLLKLKLQEDFSDYRALEKNSPEFVVQQHYRSLIRHVFSVLRDEGVALEGDLPPPPPDPLPPPPPPPVIEDEEDEEDSALDKLDADTEPDAEPAEAGPVSELPPADLTDDIQPEAIPEEASPAPEGEDEDRPPEA